jgi:ubiquinone/menaquinone biosynthesis C-methylase UbiE
VRDQEMSLHGAMLGGSEEGYQVGRMLEGLLMAQVAMTLARFGIADLLAAGPRTSEELARDAGADADALNRVLAAASVYGLVRRDADRRWTLSAAGNLLRSDSEQSARYLAAGFLGPPLWAAGSRIEDVVRGAKVDPASPGGMYEWFGQHPQEATWFARAMGRITREMVAELQTSGFRPLTGGRLVDVGGSRGTLLAHLLRSDPKSTGVLFDRAEALAEAPEFLASAGVAGRAEVVAGSFLEGVPADGDLYVLSQVLHNWDDERVRVIVGNCHRVSRPGGGLMVIEYVLPEGPEPSLAYLLDLIMLTTLGGRERTTAQHAALLAECGYTLVRETPMSQSMPWRILEFQHQPG